MQSAPGSNHLVAVSFAALSLVLHAGCSGSTFSPAADGGAGDSAKHSDASPKADSPSSHDSGHVTDGSHAHDTGHAPEAGEPSDGGHRDAHAPGDARTPPDTGTDTGQLQKDSGPGEAGSLCPAAPPSGFAICQENGLQCTYTSNPAEDCVCTYGEPPTNMLHWSCITLAAGCPASPPATGSMCSVPELTCDYGHCSGGVEVQCTAGAWQPAGGACPG